jgi:hypothetical protein
LAKSLKDGDQPRLLLWRNPSETPPPPIQIMDELVFAIVEPVSVAQAESDHVCQAQSRFFF